MSDQQPQEPVVASEQEVIEEAKPSKKAKADKKKSAAPAASAEEPVVSTSAEASEVGAKPAQPAPVAAQADRDDDLFQQGVQSLLRGEYDAADNFFGQALTYYRKQGDQVGQIDVLEQLGHLCFLRGAEAQAREYYQQAGLMRVG